MSPLTAADIDAAFEHDAHGECEGWGGWGYLGERRSKAYQAVDMGLGPEREAAIGRIAAADEFVLAYANGARWDAHRLFVWLNSINGRHFADSAFEGPEGIARAFKWGLLK